MFAIAIVFVVVVAMFIVDVSQTADAVRRNYPVIGRFRNLFTTLGEYFRQYFFAMDRDEMPFNRAEREWVYKSSRGVDNTIAFGSTKSLTPAGTVIFVNCPFPKIDEDSEPAPAVTPRPLRQTTLCRAIRGQHIRHEFRGDLATGGRGPCRKARRSPAAGSILERAGWRHTISKAAATWCSRSEPRNTACAIVRAI